MTSKVLKIFILLIIVVIVALANDGSKDVPILAEYDQKVIYTTDVSIPKNPLIEDCKERSGEFNTCGSPCGPAEEVCTAVCALVCEL